MFALDTMKFSEVVGEQSALNCTVRRGMMRLMINDTFNNDLESHIFEHNVGSEPKSDYLDDLAFMHLCQCF